MPLTSVRILPASRPRQGAGLPLDGRSAHQFIREWRAIERWQLGEHASGCRLAPARAIARDEAWREWRSQFMELSPKVSRYGPGHERTGHAPTMARTLSFGEAQRLRLP